MHDQDLDDDSLEPPSAQRVARRALVLASCACRSSLEQSAADPGAVEMHKQLQSWAADVGLRDECEPPEWKAITAPLGTLSAREDIRLSWRSEGLVVLAWALQLADLPSYDEQVDAPECGNCVGILDPDAEQLTANARLRDFAELQWLATATLSIHWRLRHHELDKSPYDFRNHLDAAPSKSARLMAVRIARGDLEIRGCPFTETSADILAECRSIAMERQQAANWLVGHATLYSEITCDT
jgi:Domain of unknown function (DUF4272)